MDRDKFISTVKALNLPVMEKCKYLVERFAISFVDALKEVAPQEYQRIISKNEGTCTKS